MSALALNFFTDISDNHGPSRLKGNKTFVSFPRVGSRRRFRGSA